MYILNKVKLSELDITYCGKKSNHSIVHSNDAIYNKLHVPIVRYIINILIFKLKKLNGGTCFIYIGLAKISEHERSISPLSFYGKQPDY